MCHKWLLSSYERIWSLLIVPSRRFLNGRRGLIQDSDRVTWFQRRTNDQGETDFIFNGASSRQGNGSILLQRIAQDAVVAKVVLMGS